MLRVPSFATSHIRTFSTAADDHTGGSVWLKQWSEANGEAHGNPHVGRYIGVYFAFGLGSAALVVVQTLILWIFCSIEVSTAIVHG
jgi:hypothetical protein